MKLHAAAYPLLDVEKMLNVKEYQTLQTLINSLELSKLGNQAIELLKAEARLYKQT